MTNQLVQKGVRYYMASKAPQVPKKMFEIEITMPVWYTKVVNVQANSLGQAKQLALATTNTERPENWGTTPTYGEPEVVAASAIGDAENDPTLTLLYGRAVDLGLVDQASVDNGMALLTLVQILDRVTKFDPLYMKKKETQV
jgi:hypothetical protein